MQFVALVASRLLIASATPDDLVDEKGSLGDVSAFVIAVSVNEAAERAGMTKASIRTTVELALRRRGVPVFQVAEGPFVFGTVIVEVTAQNKAAGLARLGIARWEISAQQVVRLLSDEATLGITWTRGGVLSGPFSEYSADVRDALNRVLDVSRPVSWTQGCATQQHVA